MTKRVLDVGNCAADHAAIRALLTTEFAAEVVQAHGPQDALAELRGGHFDLVLVNRRLDRDDGEGLAIIRQIKADAALAAVPTMLITNFAECQATAVAQGAEPGFGKAALHDPKTHVALARLLG